MKASEGNPQAPRGGDWRTVGSTRLSAPAKVGLALLLLLGLILVSVPALAAPTEFELRETFGPDGTESTEFVRPGSVAIDQQTGSVYVVDAAAGAEGDLLYKFDVEGNVVPFGGSAPYIEGNKIKDLTYFLGEANSQVAVDQVSHKVYVTSDNSITAFQADGEPANFSAGPGAGSNSIGGFTRLIGLAVDAEGAIYAADRETGVVKIFASTGEQVTEFSAPEAGNLAVNSNGTVYVKRSINQNTINKYVPSIYPVTAATTYSAASEPLGGGQPSYSLGLDRSTNEVYVAPTSDAPITVYDETDAFVVAFAGAGEEGAVSRPLGVAIHEATSRVYVSQDNIPSRIKVFGQRTFFEGRPTVESTSVLDVSADAAAFTARINPNMAETSYHFEYGLQECSLGLCASIPLGGGEIGAGHESVAVTLQQVAGLQSGTTYHFRVVAKNKFGVTEGPPRTFTTQSRGTGFDLADRRAWEMVSPANKHGALLLSTGLIQASAEGNGLAYLSAGSIEAAPDGNRSIESSSILASRGPDGSWRSKDIASANDRAAPINQELREEFDLFSPDLSRAIVETRSSTLLSPEASERTPYLRYNTVPAVFKPLVTAKQGFANVPPGTEFGGDPNDPVPPVTFRSANPRLSHVAVVSSVPLVPGAPPAPPSIYQWSAGKLEAVSKLPENEGGSFASAGQYVGSGPASMRGAVSDDGSRVFWSTGTYDFDTNALTGLYVRDTEADVTARLDVAKLDEGATGEGTSRPTFQGASSDGEVVFFTDSRQLVQGASPTGFDLYRCEIPNGEVEQGCSTLTNISTPSHGPGESADVEDIVAAISDDGSSAYFVARGVLDLAANEHGETAVGGEPNLYHWQEGEELRFIASLDPEDKGNWGSGGGKPLGRVGSLTTDGSPNGRYLAFMSERSLTGYDNLDPSSNGQAKEVFRYDAVTDELSCVSCRPSGAAPSAAAKEGQLIAAVLPGAVWLTSSDESSVYRPRSVLDNGRVFFNAFDSLVPADANGDWDVYQYESAGTGDCTSSAGNGAASFSAGGCVSLLSSGTSEEPATFLDASETGDDVFFLTTARLAVTDEDLEYDVYDARVDGVVATRQPSPECLGEACQPATAPPVDPTPASAVFRGPGNVKETARKRCPKGKHLKKRKGKVRCVARKAKQDKRRHQQGRRAGR